MAALFNDFKKSSSNQHDSESLNEVLRQMEIKQFMYEDIYDYLDSENRTAYSIIAWVCELKHLYSNIYEDKQGKHYGRTRFGFVSTKELNHTWEMNRLLERKIQLETELTRLQLKHSELKSQSDVRQKDLIKLQEQIELVDTITRTLQSNLIKQKQEIDSKDKRIKELEAQILTITTNHKNEIKQYQEKLNSSKSSFNPQVEQSNNTHITNPNRITTIDKANKLNGELMSFNKALSREVELLKAELAKGTTTEGIATPNQIPKALTANYDMKLLESKEAELKHLKRKEQSYLDVCNNFFKTVDLQSRKMGADVSNLLQGKSSETTTEDTEQLNQNYQMQLQLNTIYQSAYQSLLDASNDFDKRTKIIAKIKK